MARYLIQSPHDEAQCLRALDEVLALGASTLTGYGWGCGDGDHTGYAVVEAASRADAGRRVPAFLRPTARVVELRGFTPDEVRSFHRGL